MLNIILGMLGMLVIIVTVVVGGWKFEVGELIHIRRYIPFICFGLGFLILSASFTIIPTGYTGVKKIFGQVNERTAQNGFNSQIPFVESIEQVNNKQQDLSINKDKDTESYIWGETANRTRVYYDGITVSYIINKEKSAWIYANISNYPDLITESIVSSAIKNTSKQLSDEKATNRGIIESLSMDSLQKSLDEKYGAETITVVKINILDAGFDEEYRQAVAEKQQAQLAYEQQQIENKKSIEQAEAKAQAKIKQAEGEAEAKKISAQAEAEANETLSKSLSEDIFNQRMIEKWNGELPKVMGEGQALFDIGSLQSGTAKAEPEKKEE